MRHWFRTEQTGPWPGPVMWRYLCRCGTSAEPFYYRATAWRRGWSHALHSRRGKVRA